MGRNKEEALANYYKFHALIYDITRWTFLFGRKESYKYLPFDKEDHFRILEVGSGTGMVLKQLAKRFPKAEIVGLDLSKDMVRRAEKKMKNYPNVKVLHRAFDPSYQAEKPFDLILMSYSLSMIEPLWADLWQPIKANLNTGGYVQIVDFHKSNHQWFSKWMAVNHVYMQGKQPNWTASFEKMTDRVRNAYFGLWQYRIWVGGIQ